MSYYHNFFCLTLLDDFKLEFVKQQLCYYRLAICWLVKSRVFVIFLSAVVDCIACGERQIHKMVTSKVPTTKSVCENETPVIVPISKRRLFLTDITNEPSV